MYTSPFGERSTADEVVAGRDLHGRTAVVTGGSSGIGVDTARVFAAAGAAVTLAVRDVAAGEREAALIRSAAPDAQVQVAALQLADLASIDAFVAAWTGPLDILINNAGVMDSPETYTAAGWELQLATNHLGHFALATGLRPAMTAGARVVSVASSGHGNAPVQFDDLFFLRRPYDPSLAYGQSKTANVLFAVGAQARWGDDGITVNACMPGGIWTGLQKHWDPDVLDTVKDQAGDLVKTTAQGAATSVLLATDPGAGRLRRPLLRGLSRSCGRGRDHRRPARSAGLGPGPGRRRPAVGRVDRADRRRAAAYAGLSSWRRPGSEDRARDLNCPAVVTCSSPRCGRRDSHAHQDQGRPHVQPVIGAF